ncbi:MAG TPA: hypothetical protein VE693_10890 [Gaiellaceae bacterium]|jgi:hypothetical protein|nr:hypothetical protein [Gaiellaceae bacterium]
MQYETVLGPDDVLSERPFTDPENTEREVDVMRTMLEHERDFGKAWAEAGSQALRQAVIREYDDEGRRHLLVVPSTRRLLESSDLTAIGFFGRPRDDVDHTVLFGLEDELVERMGRYGAAGLLSYYDVELVKGEYGNLILFSTPDVPEAWYRDEVHRRAVRLSPGHYHEVRLHKGSIPGRLLDGGEIAVERTKYFDFKDADIWHGLRRFNGA